MKKTFLSELLVAERSQLSGNKLELNSGIYPVYGANGLVTYINFYEVDKPYLAVIKDGAGVGRVYKCPSKSSVLSTLQYLLPNSKIDLNYAYYWLSSLCLSKYAHGAAIPHIYYKDYKYESLLLPSLMVQKKIAERLDKVQELIAKQKEQISKLDLLIKSRFLDMFGDPISNPKKWRKEKIFDVIETNISKVKSKYTEDDTIKYVDISSIDNITNTVRRFTTYLVKNAPSRAQQCLLKDDILISTVRPNLRNIAINNRTDCNMVASSGFCVLRSNVCNPMWLFEIIKSNEFTSYLSNLTTGANYPAVKDHDVYNYLFPCPPVILQNQFANFVKSVEQQKEVFSTRLSHFETLYKSLMQEYFG